MLIDSHQMFHLEQNSKAAETGRKIFAVAANLSGGEMTTFLSSPTVVPWYTFPLHHPQFIQKNFHLIIILPAIC